MQNKPDETTTDDDRKIVSSKHLADSVGWRFSELEFGLTIFYNAFTKWIVRCSAVAGKYDLNAIDVLTLHNIYSRDNEQRRIDICFMLNIEDTHTVTYSLKKLVKQDLIAGSKRGKEIYYATTDKGKELCEQYKNIRQQCLLSGTGSFDFDVESISQIAANLRTLSGLYDQAARSAASMT